MKRHMERPGRVAPRTGSKQHPDNNNSDVLTKFSCSRLAAEPPARFLCSSCFINGRRHRVAVWNGVKDFAYPPPKGLIDYMEMEGKIVIKQINRPLWEGGTSAIKVCSDLIKTHGFDHIVFWACNKKVYRSIKAEIFAAKRNCFHPTPQ